MSAQAVPAAQPTLPTPKPSARRSWLVIGLGATCLVLGAGLAPLLTAGRPRLATAAAIVASGGEDFATIAKLPYYSQGSSSRQDGWGNSLRLIGMPNGRRAYYSSGPNGVDDEGLGDDVVLRPDEVFWARRLVSTRGLIPVGLLLLGTLLPVVRRRRDPSLRTELKRSVLVALGLAACLPGVLVLAFGPVIDGEHLAAVAPPLLPPALSALGTYLLLCFVLGLAWRLNRPPAPEA